MTRKLDSRGTFQDNFRPPTLWVTAAPPPKIDPGTPQAANLGGLYGV